MHQRRASHCESLVSPASQRHTRSHTRPTLIAALSLNSYPEPEHLNEETFLSQSAPRYTVKTLYRSTAGCSGLRYYWHCDTMRTDTGVGPSRYEGGYHNVPDEASPIDHPSTECKLNLLMRELSREAFVLPACALSQRLVKDTRTCVVVNMYIDQPNLSIFVIITASSTLKNS